MPAKINKDECVGCGTCVDACPEAAIEMEEEFAKVDESLCNECGTCVESCPTEAIKLEK
ncbi:ferredoxin [Methanocella sp. CWC-04]|uniref:Ferredoxin n=1 Tax=Methanooceanicella nereidis TaxID=2052831 RepID=A0AAP2W5R3_9EURY|nr:4Fe-4S binding protein [Methanocella sp. CWC-04]MCD1294583.1 ferredoxin [Methanocella sp. CWC-04]